MHYHSEALICDLSAKAQSFRIQVLKMIFRAQTGHLGGAFSCAVYRSDDVVVRSARGAARMNVGARHAGDLRSRYLRDAGGG